MKATPLSKILRSSSNQDRPQLAHSTYGSMASVLDIAIARARLCRRERVGAQEQQGTPHESSHCTWHSVIQVSNAHVLSERAMASCQQ